MDHMKLSLAHVFFRIQSIEMIPLHKFNKVIPNAQYKKCEYKIKKIWYNFMQEVFFELMYKVNFFFSWVPFFRIVSFNSKLDVFF